MKNLKIKTVDAFSDNSKLVEINNEKFLSCFQVDLLIEVTNKFGKTMGFNISLQSEEIDNRLRSYCNWGMITSADYGNDGDESRLLESWLEDTDEEKFYDDIINNCEVEAEILAKDEYDTLIEG